MSRFFIVLSSADESAEQAYRFIWSSQTQQARAEPTFVTFAAGVRFPFMNEEPKREEHVEQTVEQLSRLYDDHQRNTTRVQRVANGVTATLGRPLALVTIFGLVIAWTAGNYVARELGSTALEQPPFPDLEFIVTVTALLVALLILTTQRHGDELAERRAKLTLQIAALSEKKIAKVIELLEDQRRDNPLLPTREDRVASAMAKPVDAVDELER